MENQNKWYRRKIKFLVLFILCSGFCTIQLVKKIQTEQDIAEYYNKDIIGHTVYLANLQLPSQPIFGFKSTYTYQMHMAGLDPSTTTTNDSFLLDVYGQISQAYQYYEYFLPRIYSEQAQKNENIKKLLYAHMYFLATHGTKELFQQDQADYAALLDYTLQFEQICADEYYAAKKGLEPIPKIWLLDFDISLIDTYAQRFDALLAQDDGTFERLVQKYAQIP